MSVKKRTWLLNQIQTVVVGSARQDSPQRHRVWLGARTCLQLHWGRGLGEAPPFQARLSVAAQDHQGGWEVESLFTEDTCSADTQGSAIHGRRRKCV